MAEINEPFFELFRPHRWKVFYGGRGSGKSWSFARALLRIADLSSVRVLCAREYQSSMRDSVHMLLSDQIAILGLSRRFEITREEIVNVATGSIFSFRGLRRNVAEIKSTEGIDICWVEEAQSVSRESWDTLAPTIRKAGSEIWVSFNPNYSTDATCKMFIDSPPPGAYVRKINYDENPWLADTILGQIEVCKQRDLDAYAHIWLGETVKHSNLVIFANKFRVESFDTPPNAEFYHGIDWGFSCDATAAVRCFERTENGETDLFIDAECYGTGIDTGDLANVFDRDIPTLRKWRSFADSARPETIAYLNRRGFPLIKSVAKWPGSVEDGIEFLRGHYRSIVIHERCKNVADEFRLYSYRVDKSGDPTPVPEDKNNHAIDALRYALSKRMKGKKGFF